MPESLVHVLHAAVFASSSFESVDRTSPNSTAQSISWQIVHRSLALHSSTRHSLSSPAHELPSISSLQSLHQGERTSAVGLADNVVIADEVCDDGDVVMVEPGLKFVLAPAIAVTTPRSAAVVSTLEEGDVVDDVIVLAPAIAVTMPKSATVVSTLEEGDVEDELMSVETEVAVAAGIPFRVGLLLGTLKQSGPAQERAGSHHAVV